MRPLFQNKSLAIKMLDVGIFRNENEFSVRDHFGEFLKFNRHWNKIFVFFVGNPELTFLL